MRREPSARAAAHPKPRRLFSLKEANRALPLVSRIIRDIVESYGKISDLHSQEREHAAAGHAQMAQALNDQVHEAMGAVDEFIEELREIGCEFKDPLQGLVDFPARLGNRIVYLCWKMGEPEIRWWHDLHSGFSGRQPIAGNFS